MCDDKALSPEFIEAFGRAIEDITGGDPFV
jgi:hypothetical protein